MYARARQLAKWYSVILSEIFTVGTLDPNKGFRIQNSNRTFEKQGRIQEPGIKPFKRFQGGWPKLGMPTGNLQEILYTPVSQRKDKFIHIYLFKIYYWDDFD